MKKPLLKNFAIFTGKQLCWRLFLIKLQAFRLKIMGFFFVKAKYIHKYNIILNETVIKLL